MPSPAFVTMMPLDCYWRACAIGGLTARQNNHEDEDQIGSRDTDSTGNVGAYVCASPRRCATGRAVGSVSNNRWSVGDLRFAVREIEIDTQCQKQRPNTIKRGAQALFGHEHSVLVDSIGRTFSAGKPFGLFVTSNCTVWPSCKLQKPPA